MKIAMLRVGIDTGSGGIHGPLFRDGSFDFVSIPDGFGGVGVDTRTYGNTTGLKGRLLIDYFPESRRRVMATQSIHVDPEFTTFTYGDPASPKAGLRHLERGDLLVFYCGLEGWDHMSAPALYIVGYFEVHVAGRADTFGDLDRQRLFADNFHVRHPRVFERQRSELVLVKGGAGSRLLEKAVCISVVGRDRAGHPLKVLSPEMQEIFGTFKGRLSFQRSPTRWVEPGRVVRAASFIRSLA